MIDFVTDVSAVRMGPGNEPTFTQTTQDVLGKKRKVNMIKNSCTFGDRGMAVEVSSPQKDALASAFILIGSLKIPSHTRFQRRSVSYNSVAFQDRNIKGLFPTRHANYSTDLSSQEKQWLAHSFCLENAFIC